MFDLDISFIVPMKNEEDTILNCINSIVHNASKMEDYSYEIIAIDDHSTDSTVDILNKNRCPCTILSAGTITGPAAVRNYATTQTKGKVLVFIDGDVILNPDWHEFFPETYQSTLNDRIISGSQVFVDPKESSWIVKTWFVNRDARINTNYINSGHLIISKSLFNLVGQFDESLDSGEDSALCQTAKTKFSTRIINNSNLIAIHKGYPTTLRNFFNRERWHGKGNWKGINLTSRMTWFILLFWLGLFFIPFTAGWSLFVPTFVVGLLAGKKKVHRRRIIDGAILSTTVFIARGLSLIDVFTGKVSRTRG